MNLSEIKDINKAIDEFYKNYTWLLGNKYRYFTVEDYIDNLQNRFDKISQHFNYHYPYKIDIFNELEPYHLISFQPSDPKHGFLGSLFSLEDHLHLITKVGVEYKNGKPNMGVSLLFITFDGLQPAYDFCIKHENLINFEVYDEPKISSGFGL